MGRLLVYASQEEDLSKWVLRVAKPESYRFRDKTKKNRLEWDFNIAQWKIVKMLSGPLVREALLRFSLNSTQVFIGASTYSIYNYEITDQIRICTIFAFFLEMPSARWCLREMSCR